jgi:hypothetical protein
MYSCTGDEDTVKPDDDQEKETTTDLEATTDPRNDPTADPQEDRPIVNILDDIGLETKEISVGAEETTFTVKTKIDGWGVGLFYFYNDGDTLIEESQYITIPYRDGVYDLRVLPDIFRRYWLEAARTGNGFVLRVKVEENTSGKKREARILLSGMMLEGGQLHITQALRQAQ